MEKLFNQYDKACMRMAMLKHEETFKQQVYELHRLYRIQKMLMDNLEIAGSIKRNQERWNSSKLGEIKRRQDAPDEDRNEVLGIIDESDIELTLGPTNYDIRKKGGTSPTSNSASSCSSGCSHIKITGFGTHQRTDSRREDELEKPLLLFQPLSMNMT